MFTESPSPKMVSIATSLERDRNVSLNIYILYTHRGEDKGELGGAKRRI